MCIAVRKLSNMYIYIFTISLNEGKEVMNIVGHVFVNSVHIYTGICMHCSMALVIAE